MSQPNKNTTLASILAKPERKVWRRSMVPMPGQGVPRIAVGVFDATGGKAIGSYDLGIHVPIGAVVLRAWYVVVTTFTSSGADAGTIAMSCETASPADLVVAIAISDGSNPWDSGSGVPALYNITLGAPIVTTAERALTAAVAVDKLLTGVLHLFVEYVQA